jgi:hypothetical protein
MPCEKRYQFRYDTWDIHFSEALDPATRNIAIGRLQAGESQNEVARTLNVNQSTISRQWNRFQQTGSTHDRCNPGIPAEVVDAATVLFRTKDPDVPILLRSSYARSTTPLAVMR